MDSLIEKELINNPWLKNFDYNTSSNQTRCIKCERKFFKGFHVGNLKRHYLQVHEKDAANDMCTIKRRNQDSNYGNSSGNSKKVRTKSDFMRSCVGIICEDLVPFDLFSSPNFKSILNDRDSKFNVTANPSNVRKWVEDASIKIKQKIADEVKAKLLSIKVDIGSRPSRSFLGINVQFYSDSEGKIVIRNLGMLEIHDKHTAANINSMIVALLEDFGIPLTSIIAFTCDNAANVVKAGKGLKNLQNAVIVNAKMAQFRQKLLDNLSSDDEECESDDDYTDDDDKLSKRVQEAIDNFNSIISLIPCAIHTEQLAVHDTLKSQLFEGKHHFKIVRSAVKSMKSSTYTSLARRLKLKIPGIDCITRWNSTYMMTSKLEKYEEQWKSVCENLTGKELEAVNIPELTWDFVKEFNEVFQHPFYLTMLLQHNNLSLGDFYIAWRQCWYQLKLLSRDSKLAADLHEKFTIRTEMMLTNNHALLGGLFIDPHFNSIGKKFYSIENRCENAKIYILSVYKSVMKLKGISTSTYALTSSSEPATFDDCISSEMDCSQDSNDYSDEAILKRIERIADQNSVAASDVNFDIFNYLKIKYIDDPVMADTCLAIVSVAMTSKSVEQAFSAMKLMLTDLRRNLTSKICNDIMRVKLNSPLLDSINFDEVEI